MSKNSLYTSLPFITLQISSNGALSFRTPFYVFIPEPFPIPSNVLIAPFWDDSDNSAGGQVLYRFRNDQPLLDLIAEIVYKYFFVYFHPWEVFIVTWAGLPQYSGPLNVVSIDVGHVHIQSCSCNFFQVNTFQAVLTTDGSSTYVFFLYRDLQWGDSDTTVGFNAGDGINGFNVPESNTTDGILNLESLTNIDIPGAFLFRVDQPQIILPSGKIRIVSKFTVKIQNTVCCEINLYPTHMIVTS